MQGEQQLRAAALQALEVSEADETEVVVSAEQSAVTRFANSAIHQNVLEVALELRVRAVLGSRVGVAITNQIDEGSVGEVVRRATEVAKYAPEDSAYRGLPDPSPIPVVPCYSSVTASYSPEQRAKDVKGVCDLALAQGLEASGMWATGAGELAIANSRGVWAYAARTSGSFKTVVLGDGSSGYAERTAVDVTEVDVEAAGREAVGKALRSREPMALEPGEYPVVLEPYAVAAVIDYLAFMGLGALELQEGRSFLCGRLGERLVGENVSLWDDGLDPAGMPVPFDFEGVPKQRVTFFDRGRAMGVVYDSYTAGREGKNSTGHALAAPNRHGPVPLNLFLAPGDAEEEDLVRGMRRGLWVTRFHYVNVVHPTRTIITGMTRDGTFLIEDGQITRPVRNLRFTQSVLEALSCVEAIGRSARLIQDELGGTCVPALRIGRFRFSSATEY